MGIRCVGYTTHTQKNGRHDLHHDDPHPPRGLRARQADRGDLRRRRLRPRGRRCHGRRPPAGGAEEAAEKTEFDLVITDVDASKRIAIIKVVRGLTSLGLKEAKDAVTNLPFTILEGKTKGEVEEAMKELEAGGAKCEMK